MSDNNKKVGICSLIGIIISSMIGAGVFSLATDMASGAGIIAILIGWLITGVGMICLALIYQNLSNRKPELDGGIYSYASAGFGKFIGFNSAWGYWFSAFAGNVAFCVLLFDALAYFFPIFAGEKNIYALIGATFIVWVVHFIALRGVHQAVVINMITTITRLVPIFLSIIVMFFVFNYEYISFKPFGTEGMGSILKQVSSTMMTTLWVFIGVEGAVVISGRAKSKSDVGKATVIGLIITLLIYLGLNLVTLSAIPRDILMTYENPTLAYSLSYVIGHWGAVITNAGLCIALFGALLSWTLLAAEVPYVAAKDGIMPNFFANENANKAPSASLWITNGSVQAFLLYLYFSGGSYQFVYIIASVAILLPYLFSGLYALKVAILKDGYNAHESNIKDIIISVIASVYGLWLVIAAYMDNYLNLLVCAILYFVGLFVYIYSKIQAKDKKIFTKNELVIAVIITILAIYGVYELCL